MTIGFAISGVILLCERVGLFLLNLSTPDRSVFAMFFLSDILITKSFYAKEVSESSKSAETFNCMFPFPIHPKTVLSENLPIIPHICHGRHGHVRVKNFWPV